MTLRRALDKAERAGEDLSTTEAGDREVGGGGGGSSVGGMSQRSRDNAAHIATTTADAIVSAALKRHGDGDGDAGGGNTVVSSVVSVGRCGWDGVPRDMGSMLLTDIAAWAKPGEAGDAAPIAAALAVAERVAAAASPDVAGEWASPGSVAATTALGKSLAGCLARHAEAVMAAADAVAGDDNATTAYGGAAGLTLRDEPSDSSSSLSLSSSSSSGYSREHRRRGDSSSGGERGGGGGIGALRRYLAATGHREAGNRPFGTLVHSLARLLVHWSIQSSTPLIRSFARLKRRLNVGTDV